MAKPTTSGMFHACFPTDPSQMLPRGLFIYIQTDMSSIELLNGAKVAELCEVRDASPFNSSSTTCGGFCFVYGHINQGIDCARCTRRIPSLKLPEAQSTRPAVAW